MRAERCRRLGTVCADDEGNAGMRHVGNCRKKGEGERGKYEAKSKSNGHRILARTTVRIGRVGSEGRKDESQREWGGMRSTGDNQDQLRELDTAFNSRLPTRDRSKLLWI